MKTLNKILILLPILLFAMGCELDQQPFDRISEKTVTTNEEYVDAITAGQYAKFKDWITIRSQKPWWSRMPRTYEIFSLQGDDAFYGQTTGAEDMFFSAIFEPKVNGQFNQIWYYIPYSNIGVCNRIINDVTPTTDKMKELVAENYFLRAFNYSMLIRLYGKPYTHGRDNFGVPLILKPQTAPIARATVGEIFDQIISDLKKAEELGLPDISSVTDRGRASKQANWGMLCRIYNWMIDPENPDVALCNEVIKYADLLLGDANCKIDSPADYFGRLDLFDPETFLTGRPFNHYYANAKKSKETLFCIARQSTEALDKQDRGALWMDDGLGRGWGQIFASFGYRNSINKYPQDLRHLFFEPNYKRVNGTLQRDPVTNEPIVVIFRDQKYSQSYYINKHGYQDGNMTLQSEVMLRMGEIVLNKAEAYAKLGNTSEALKAVNQIRQRAGLADTALYNEDGSNISEVIGADFITNNNPVTFQPIANPTVLDAVIMERKLELSWDLWRSYDIFRNKRNLNNMMYDGSIINVLWTEDRVAYRIPETEMNLNPLLVQYVGLP
jgi:starch-binding outer membrane protein, SusD/RagB family